MPVITVLTISAPYNLLATNFHLNVASIVATTVESHFNVPVAVTTGSNPNLKIIRLHKDFITQLDFPSYDFKCSLIGCAQGVLLRFSRLRCLLNHHSVEFTSYNSTSTHNHNNHSNYPAKSSLSTP